MHALVLVNVNLHTNFELLPSYTNSTDMIKAQNSKMDHMTLTTPRSVVLCHP